MPSRIHHAQVLRWQGSFYQLRHTSLYRLWWLRCVLLLEDRKLPWFFTFEIFTLPTIKNYNILLGRHLGRKSSGFTSSERNCGAMLRMRAITWSTLIVTFCSKSSGFITCTGTEGIIGLRHDQDKSSSLKNIARWCHICWFCCTCKGSKKKKKSSYQLNQGLQIKIRCWYICSWE